MCGLFLCEIIKGFHHYARILIFLSCFGIYSDFSDNHQMTLYDAVFGLTDSEKRMLEKSRPNTPVGALL